MTDEKKLNNALKSNDISEINSVFEYLYLKYKPYVAFVSANYLTNTCDIDDVIQEVFMEFFNNANKVKSSIKSYLAILAKNRSIDLYRKNKKIVIVEESVLDINNPPDNIDLIKERHKSLDDLINDLKLCLTEVEVKIILLHLLEFETFKDIGVIVSMNEKTVKSCYYRALKKYEKWRNKE